GREVVDSIRGGAMRGFHNSTFDPQTLVLLEVAFDEAWLTLKSVGNKTLSPMSWLALCCAWPWKASAILFDCTMDRWTDCYPLPPGARRIDRGVTQLASATPLISATPSLIDFAGAPVQRNLASLL